MKIIDILNKIAKGELKEKITFEYHGIIYDFDSFWEDFTFTEHILNEIVVVIEKGEVAEKIEKIPTEEIEISMCIGEQICANKINEIIDKLNDLDK